MVTKVPDRQRMAGHREASTKITTALAQVDFPISKEELAEEIGDVRVEIDEGEALAIKDMLKHIRREGFKNLSAAQNALDRHWAAYRGELGLQDTVPERITRPGGESMAAQREEV